MAARRSKRINGEKLSDDFAEVEFQTKRQLYLMRRVAQEEKHAQVTCKFTIFDLVPELRAQIYAHAMQTDLPRPLGCLPYACFMRQDPPHAHGEFEVPILAMVSKQIRAEVLPILFSDDIETLNTLAVQDALPTRVFWQEPNDWLRREHNSSGRIEDLFVTKPLLLRLRKRDHVGNFRNVELLVGGPMVELGTATQETKYETSRVIITVPTAIRLRPQIRFLDPPGGSRFPTELGRLRTKAAARAIQIAETREKFLGYTIHDLEAIVMELRYWPNV
ncbi:hypothetical protein LTR56_026267 [Elasticomyces elasticus]|nr:hypothetical protein LTR56_026267 [Elasticomyces elasticus]KAK5759505.1 hypothetical protein LTS12_010363 [Elasticomyces elasticus]